MKKISVSFILLFFASVLFAFITFPTATLTVDKTDIKIGETINAKIEVSVPDFVQLLDREEDVSVPGWDIQEISFKKDILSEGKYEISLKIATFDSRLKEVPAVRLSYVNKNEDNEQSQDVFYFFTNSVPVTINNLFAGDDFSDIRDIKQSKKMNISLIYYAVAVLYGLFVIVVIYWQVIKNKADKLIQIKRPFTASETAFKNLNKLHMKYEASQCSVKDFYFELSSILNHFISETLEIKKEMTTSEIMELIKKEDNVFNKYAGEISEFFELYDKIKYTKNENVSDKNIVENSRQIRFFIVKICI